MARGKYGIRGKFKKRMVVGKRTFRTKKVADNMLKKLKKQESKNWKNFKVITRESLAKSVLRGNRIYQSKTGKKPLSKKSARTFLSKNK